MQMMALQSGSNGNCVFVEANGVRLLIDAGISGIQMQQRLAVTGVDPRDIHALLISHDHGDHTRSLGVYQRKYGIPVYVTPATLAAAAPVPIFCRNFRRLFIVMHSSVWWAMPAIQCGLWTLYQPHLNCIVEWIHFCVKHKTREKRAG